HRGGDASAVADLVAVLAGPLADSRGLLGVAGGGASRAGSTATADPAAARCPGLELLAQLLCVDVVQVDFVGHTVEGEGHRLVGLAAINIVGENHPSLTRHY